MKTINIAHLYYDLMNLNGEAGNIMALKSHFESQGLKINISLLTIDDKIDFNNLSLEEKEITSVMDSLIKNFKKEFNAELR